jgi:hypothetical protein
MTRRLGEEERVTKQVKRASDRRYSRVLKADPTTLHVDRSPVANGIEPLDRFDPNEFGIGLRDLQSRP